MVVSDSVIIVADESVAITVVSVEITVVASANVASVLDLLWQAASVKMLLTNNKVKAFFMLVSTVVWFYRQIYFF